MFDHLSLSLPGASVLTKRSSRSILWFLARSRFPLLPLLQQAT